MTISWILNSRINTLIFVLITTLQITSCSTEEVQEILAGIEENTQTSNIANTASSSNASNTANTASTASTASTSNTSNTADPTATNAMFSYSSDLSNPRLLSGATLDRTTVYMFFTNTADYSKMTFYCCKGLTGNSEGEAHNASVSDTSAPFVYQIDLSQYTTTGIRELYVDATRANSNPGDTPDAFAINFTLATTQTTSTPPPATPLAVSDVSLSWVAPFEREDNNPISPAEIAGYKIYYGTAQGDYTNSINISDGSTDSYTVESLTEGTYYFVITTLDTEGRESAYSPVITKTI